MVRQACEARALSDVVVAPWWQRINVLLITVGVMLLCRPVSVS